MSHRQASRAAMARAGRRRRAALAGAAIVVAFGIGGAGASADPANPSQPIAVIVALPADHLPQSGSGQPKQIDLRGVPVMVSTEADTRIGARGAYHLDLGDGISIDSHGTVIRTNLADLAIGSWEDDEAVDADATIGFSRGAVDFSLTPSLGFARPESVAAPDRGLNASFGDKLAAGWRLSTSHGYALRQSATPQGDAGRSGFSAFGVSHQLAAGAGLDLGYRADWLSPDAGGVGQSLTVATDFDLATDIDCHVEYRYRLAQDAFAATDPAGPGAQELALNMAWDLAGEGFGSASLKAAVSLQRTDSGAEPTATAGTGNLNLVVGF